MKHAERLLPSCTWEAATEMLMTSLAVGLPGAPYERALRVAEVALAGCGELAIALAGAAFGSLRLGRPADGLRHCEVALALGKEKLGTLSHTLQAGRVITLAQLGRVDEARLALAELQRALAAEANPDAEDVRLLREEERAVGR
jgi:hypothetical protein